MLFALRKKYKDERIDLMQSLVEIFMYSSIGVHIRKDIAEFCKCKSEYWMQTDYDENMLEYWRLTNGNYVVKFKKYGELDGDNDVLNTLPSPLIKELFFKY